MTRQLFETGMPDRCVGCRKPEQLASTIAALVIDLEMNVTDATNLFRSQIEEKCGQDAIFSENGSCAFQAD